MTTTYQHPLTVITPIDPSKLEYLRVLLNSIQNPNIESNNIIAFTKVKSVHFARFVLIEDSTDKYPIQLAFSFDFDGDESCFLTELMRVAKDGIHEIYSCCLAYTGNLLEYWNKHKVHVNAFYNGHLGIGTEQIRQEDELRKTIIDYLDDACLKGNINNQSAIELNERLVQS